MSDLDQTNTNPDPAPAATPPAPVAPPPAPSVVEGPAPSVVEGPPPPPGVDGTTPPVEPTPSTAPPASPASPEPASPASSAPAESPLSDEPPPASFAEFIGVSDDAPIEEPAASAPSPPEPAASPEPPTPPVQSEESSSGPVAPPTQPEVAPAIESAPPPPPSAPLPSSPAPSAPIAPPGMPAAPEEVPPASVGPRAVIARDNSRILRIALSALVGLVALAAIFFLLFYRVKVSINTNPVADKITIDSKDYQPGTYKLMPGVHTVTIQKAGYISYRVSRKFSIGEKLDLSFALQKAKAPALISAGAKLPESSYTGTLVNFLSLPGALSTVGQQTTSTAPAIATLSNGLFPTARQILYSDKNNFALVLDTEALKVIDFSRVDLVNQVETKLPPAAGSISAITINRGSNNPATPANSKIIYDMKVDYGWNLNMASLDFKQSETLMQIDATKFNSLKLDWSDSANDVLLCGGELGTYNLSTRVYTTISKDADFSSCKWGPLAKYAVALDKQGNVYKISNLQATKIGSGATVNQVVFTTANSALIIAGDTPIEYNFDTNGQTNYAEISGLDVAQSFAYAANAIYFADKDGLKSAGLEVVKY